MDVTECIKDLDAVDEFPELIALLCENMPREKAIAAVEMIDQLAAAAEQRGKDKVWSDMRDAVVKKNVSPVNE
jgi:hypothetical protein